MSLLDMCSYIKGMRDMALAINNYNESMHSEMVKV